MRRRTIECERHEYAAICSVAKISPQLDVAIPGSERAHTCHRIRHVHLDGDIHVAQMLIEVVDIERRVFGKPATDSERPLPIRWGLEPVRKEGEVWSRI